MIEVAHAVSRTRGDSRLKRFYLRIKARSGAKVAIVALARKIVCILHHLIFNREMFKDESTERPKRSKLKGTISAGKLTIDDAISILAKAGYVVQKREGGEGG